jgi:hypothetical protein
MAGPGLGTARQGKARHRHGAARQGKTQDKETTQMKIALAKLESVSPYSQSRHYDKVEVKPLDKENDRDYESRTWRNRLHVNENGQVFIPPMAFKNCLTEAAKFLAIQIPNKGKATYTKHFEAGVLVTEPIVLPLLRDKVEHEVLFVPSNGMRGAGKRVEKVFPIIREWKGTLQIVVFDETILNAFDSSKKTVLQHVLEQGGMFVGIGRFRPRNNGFYGRFKIQEFAVQEA